MSTQVIKAFCKWCGEPLPPSHIGKCPKCGKVGKNISASFSETITIQDFLDWERIQKYYRENKKIKWLAFAITFGSPLIGFWVNGVLGVILGLAIGLISWIIPPWRELVSEITKGSSR